MVTLLAAVMGCLPTFAEPAKPVIPEGHRAFSIKLNPAQGGGFIQPGNRVDVIHVVKVDGKNKASVIVSDVLVLAVETVQKEKNIDATITLAVKIDDAVKLAAAETDGRLRLALRAPDAKREEPKPVVLPEGYRLYRTRTINQGELKFVVRSP
jgi:Flp pilus assembly protein CpaB